MASSKPVKCSAKSAQNVDCCGQDACAATTSQASPSGSMLLELNTAVLEGRAAALIGERPVVRRYEGNHPSRRSHSKSLQRRIQSTQLEPIPGGNPRRPSSFQLTESESEVRMPTRQPTLGRVPVDFLHFPQQHTGHWIGASCSSCAWRLAGKTVRSNSSSTVRAMHVASPRHNVSVNAWTPCGGPVLSAGREPKENYIYKSVFTIAAP